MTGTQDKYGHTPLSYLPQRAKRIGLMTPAVDGRTALWAVEQVGKDGVPLKGSVAQSLEVRVLAKMGYVLRRRRRAAERQRDQL